MHGTNVKIEVFLCHKTLTSLSFFQAKNMHAHTKWNIRWYSFIEH